MFTSNRHFLKIFNQALYCLSIALLVSGLILSLAARPVEAASGSVKTKNSCGVSAQDANSYAVGDTIYVAYSGLGTGTHSWMINYTNKPGKPLVAIVGSSPLKQGTGTVSGDSGCFPAWVAQPEEAGFHFTVEVGEKSDGYNVTASTTTSTATATNTPTSTATFTPTASATHTPTATFSPTATCTATPAFTATPTHTAAATLTPTTPAPTETTPTPTKTPPDPTETTPAPTETPPDPTETTPAPTETPPAPTDSSPTDPALDPTPISTLSMPAAVDSLMVSPITGADILNSASDGGKPGTLFKGSLSVFGLALVISGYRRKKGL